MSFEETVVAHIRLLEAGRVADAIAQHFADFGILYANGETVGEGPADILQRQKPFFDSAQDITCHITDLKLDPYAEFCAFKNVTKYKDAAGHPHAVEQLHVEMWASGKIATQWVYSGEPMQGMISRGLLDDPAHILELIG